MSKWLTIIVFIIFFIKDRSCLSICPTGEWDGNAITVAGSSFGSSGNSSSMLYWPGDVYVNNNEEIYVLDSGNYRVQRFLPNLFDGTTVVNGSYGTELNQFSTMDAMKIDADENIYILDGGNGRVTKWTPGASSGIIVAGGYGYGNDTNQIGGAGGMFVDPNTSTIWISDSNNNRIVKWLSSTTVEYVCGSSGPGLDQFYYPRGLFVDIDNANTLYVADTGNHRIQQWFHGDTYGRTVAGITGYYGSALNQLWLPQTLILDTNGWMFIDDRYNDRILKWIIGEHSGLRIAGKETMYSYVKALLYTLFYPMGINFDSAGSLFVADTGSHRIQKFSISCPSIISTTTIQSTITTTMPSSNNDCSTMKWSLNGSTIAGSPIGWSYLNQELLQNPYDACLDSDDTLYVLDSGNNRVQRYLSNDTVGTTVINASGTGSEIDQFGEMRSIDIDSDHTIYILDRTLARVTQWKKGALYGRIVAGGNGTGDGVNQLNSPFGMFIESNPLIIWIADTGNHRIVKWMSPSTSIVICGSYGWSADQFRSPHGLFVDTKASNTLFVADTENHRIQMWLPNATSGITVAGQTDVPGSNLNRLSIPFAVIGDGNGVLYIVDTGNNRIMRWPVNSNKGEIIAGGSTYGSLPQQLFLPYNIRFDSHGSLIVVDYGNNRIQKFQIACLPNTMNGSTSQSIGTTTPTQSWSVTTNRGSIDSTNYCFKWSLISLLIIIIHKNNSF